MYMVVERGNHGRKDHPLRTADACDANICCRASDRSAWMTRYAGLLVQLVTSDPRVRRAVEAGGEATAVMSRMQALEIKSTSATTSVGQRFRGMEATQCKPHVWSGEKNSELLTSFRMELQLCRNTA